MRINRENRVKMLQNVGKYLMENADNLIPIENAGRAYKQIYTIELSVDLEVPRVEVSTEYIADEVLIGVDWSKYNV